jgi:hypothetical protein
MAMMGDHVVINEKKLKKSAEEQAVWDDLKQMLASSLLMMMKELNEFNGKIVAVDLGKFHTGMRAHITWKLAKMKTMREQLDLFKDTADKVLSVVADGLETGMQQMDTVMEAAVMTNVAEHISPMIFQIVQREAERAERKAHAEVVEMQRRNGVLVRELTTLMEKAKAWRAETAAARRKCEYMEVELKRVDERVG